MRAYLIAAGVLLIAAAVLTLMHLTLPAILAALAAVVAVLIWIFRRKGRRGDFSRSGWTGS